MSSPAAKPCPTVYEWNVYDRLKSLNRRKAGGPDGISAKLIREFAYELSYPLTDILNSSYQHGIVPLQWKRATVIPLPKSSPPPWDKLSAVSLTDHFAKLAESFITEWILSDIENNIDPNQFGNRKEVSTLHYLVKLMNMLRSHTDKLKSRCSVVITDFSNAFDLINHNIVICDLLNLGTRPSVIPWVCSFLEQRSQCVRYQNHVSAYITLKGGLPQGTGLAHLALKYVDDMTIVQNSRVDDDDSIQSVLDEFCRWATQNDMKLNPDKCVNMNVCFMKNSPEIVPLKMCLKDFKQVDNVKIPGVTISSDLKWDLHMSQVLRKASSKLFMLKVLKNFKLSTFDLLTIYRGYIRPLFTVV